MHAQTRIRSKALVVKAKEWIPQMAAPSTDRAVDITTCLVGTSPVAKYDTITVERMPAFLCAKNTGMVAYL